MTYSKSATFLKIFSMIKKTTTEEDPNKEINDLTNEIKEYEKKCSEVSLKIQESKKRESVSRCTIEKYTALNENLQKRINNMDEKAKTDEDNKKSEFVSNQKTKNKEIEEIERNILEYEKHCRDIETELRDMRIYYDRINDELETRIYEIQLNTMCYQNKTAQLNMINQELEKYLESLKTQ